MAVSLFLGDGFVLSISIGQPYIVIFFVFCLVFVQFSDLVDVEIREFFKVTGFI